MPLFPLNTALVPGLVMPLHIFEPRYRAMVDGLLAEASQMQVPLEDLVDLLHQRARAFAKKPSLQNPEDHAS